MSSFAPPPRCNPSHLHLVLVLSLVWRAKSARKKLFRSPPSTRKMKKSGAGPRNARRRLSTGSFALDKTTSSNTMRTRKRNPATGRLTYHSWRRRPPWSFGLIRRQPSQKWMSRAVNGGERDHNGDDDDDETSPFLSKILVSPSLYCFLKFSWSASAQDARPPPPPRRRAGSVEGPPTTARQAPSGATTT